MRNKAYFKANAGKGKQKRDKRQGERDGTHTERKPETLEACTTCTQWTRPPPQRESHNGSPATLENQIYLNFCRFWSPKIPRKHQTPPKNHLLLPLFAPFCAD